MFLFKLRPPLMLQGKKTSLRPLQKEDCSVIISWFGDQEIMELAFGLPKNDVGFQSLVQTYKKELESNRSSFFSVREGEDLIGFTSHALFEQGKRARIGILIGVREYWSKGYGRDALVTLLRHLFLDKGVQVAELDTSYFNIRAQRCFESCGFQRVEKNQDGSPDRFWYELWEADFLRRFENVAALR